MAIAAVRRFDLLGHVSTKAAVLTRLQALGITHLEDATPLWHEADEATRPALEPPPDAGPLEERLLLVERCRTFMDRYAPKRSLAQQLMEPRLLISRGQFEHTVDNFALERAAEHIADLESQLATARAQITKLEVLREDLRHWEHLDCPCSEITPTRTVDATLAVIDTAALPKLQAELAAATALVHLQLLEGTGPSSYLILYVFQAVAEQVGPVLKKYGCRAVDFTDLQGTPRTVRERFGEEILALRARVTELETKAADVAADRTPLLILSDYYSDRVAAAHVEQEMLHTRSAFYLAGWVPVREEARLGQAMRELSHTLALELRDPLPDEDPPVLLENGPAEPFQMLTGLYGTPTYRSTDPTPWLAPWFAVFFGLCLTDAGYGFILTGLLGWALVRLPLEGGMRQLMRVLFLGGLCTIAAGTVTGGWFGISPEALPGPLRRLTLLNPMVDGMTALLLSLGIGLVQVWLGVLLMLRHNLRQRRVVDALVDQGIWLVFIPALATLAYTFVGPVPAGLVDVAKTAALLCTAAVVLFGWREGHPLVRLALGPARLYDAVGYFGDVLSYSRLFALGLATGAIAQVTNILAGQALAGIPWGIGHVAAGLILVVGHTMNLVINALGAFIHSMRLQFIEFFQKFFQDGGTAFRPFAQARTYTAIESA